MIRLTLLWLFIVFVSLYTWKDWYKGLCGLIFLMAFAAHTDMPTSIFGIQGLNPWNILLANVVLAWLTNRKREGLKWDLPRQTNLLFMLYIAIIAIATLRMLNDIGAIKNYFFIVGAEAPSFTKLISENVINTAKWLIPGALLYDGCRSQQRFNSALLAILAMYFITAVQVIQLMPIESLTNATVLERQSHKILGAEIGYHRTDLSVMLAAGAWAFFSTRVLIKNNTGKLLAVLGSLISVFAMMLTGGRGGMVAWGAVGLLLVTIRWRIYLFLLPIILTIMVALVPAARDRLMTGLGTKNTSNISASYISLPGDEGKLEALTAGRNVAWPLVIDKIKQAPFVGYGRIAMQRKGVAAALWKKTQDQFGHPHNAYLEMLLDNGIVGLLIVLTFYFLLLKKSFLLFCMYRSPLLTTMGGVSFSVIFVQLIASMTGQSFYPQEQSGGMWCVIWLMLRVFVQYSKYQTIPSYNNQKGTQSVITGHEFWR